MPENSYVAVEQNICPVCGITHEYNTGVLIDKRLKDIPDDKRITDYGLCEEHNKLFNDGYIALIVIKNDITDKELDVSKIKMEDANRTGDVMHIRRTVFNEVFSVTLPKKQQLVFIDIELFNKLKELQNKVMKITLTQNNKKISMQTKLSGVGSAIRHLIIPILLAAGYEKKDIVEAMSAIVRNHKDGT